MDITPSTIYWATRFDNFCALLFFAGAFASIIIAFTIVAFFVKAGDDDDTTANLLVKLSPLTFIFFFMSWTAFSLMPTTKEFAAMYVVPAIVNNDKLQTVGNRFYDLALEWMDELTPHKHKTSLKTSTSGCSATIDAEP